MRPVSPVAFFHNVFRLWNLKVEPRQLLFHFLFFYPALYILSFYLFLASDFNATEFGETFLYCFILVLISHLLPAGRLRFFYLLFALLFSYVSVFIEVFYYYLYRDSISESTIYIILETNVSEASDYISMHFDSQALVISIGLLVPLISAIYLLFKCYPDCPHFFFLSEAWKPNKKRDWLLSFCLLLIATASLFASQLREKNFVYVMANSFTRYVKEARSYQFLGGDKLGGKFSNVSSDSQKEEVYVVVIGEATTRSHLSLYGYYRNTNPLLVTKKSELMIYTDVISPHAHTIYSLRKVLTLANADNPGRFKDGSLLQLLNKAGFSTYWISNQNPIGIDETLVTSLAKAAQKSYYTNTSSWKSVTPYDDKVLKPLKAVLSEKNKKKFIVLHLMGTHGKYHRRYPEHFARFTDTPKTPFPSERAFKNINAYDNANLYNDYIIDSVINLIKNEQKKAWVLYFSDHGEDVFETIDKATHTDAGGTKPMFDIPFLLWLSNEYKSGDKSHVFDTSRKYMTDDLIYTIADLSYVRFTEFDSSRSLVNAKFLERKRPLDKIGEYDKIFSK